MYNITFSYPKSVNVITKNKITNSFSKKFDISECLLCNNGNIISQRIKADNGDVTKITTIILPKKNYYSKEFKNIQQYDLDGTFSSVRYIDNENISGYLFKPNEDILSHKFSKGLKGMCEKIKWRIFNDKNGCERNVLRKLVDIKL